MTDSSQNDAIRQQVSDYYGEVLASTQDLKTDACCTADAMPRYAREVLGLIHPEILDRFYGCGSPLPPVLEGATVLDLGCGTGRDAFIAAKLVGPHGRVIGIDMTDNQLAVARRHTAAQMDRFGYQQPNIRFEKGLIEDLRSADVADASVDVVISNCVINLSPDKEAVFRDIFRVLKPGGELYFSDIFASRRIPEELAQDKVLRGECLGGAMYIEDFRRMLFRLGCPDYRLTAKSRLSLHNEAVAERAGMIEFYSMTVRAFKLPLEDRCENYGQVAYYKGTIPFFPHAFVLDDHHVFQTGMPVPVCGNTADMLGQSRYGAHFHIAGDKRVHYGLFDCGPAPKSNPSESFGNCC